jgi:peptide/nickel transport system substrate-binding protein
MAEMPDSLNGLLDEAQSGRVSRRRFLRQAAVAGISLPTAAALLDSLAASGANAATAASSASSTVRMALSFNPQSPDPAIFFQNEGFTIEEACYENLVRHTPNAPTPQYQPWLATSWKVSKDAKEYAFKLRPGVKFHDGTPVDAAAWKFTAERTIKINQGPVEALEGVAAVEAPNPETVVFKLKHPVSDFLPFIASGYGIKAVSPTTVKAHQVNGDLGQAYLRKHDAGSGPYTMQSVSSNSYTLQAYAKYWGKKAHFKTAILTVIPDFTSQVLQLENGELDLMVHGVPPRDLPVLQSKGFKIWPIAGFNFNLFFVNPRRHPLLKTTAGRQALAHGINRELIVQQALGKYAQVSRQIYPAGIMPKSMPSYNPKYDPDILKKAVSQLPSSARSQNVDVAYMNDDSSNVLISQLLLTELQAAGLKATARAVTQPESFDYPTKPAGRPDILVNDGIASDAAAAAPYANLFMAKGGPLNYMAVTVPGADELIQKGLLQTKQSKVLQLDQQAALLYAKSGYFIPLCDRGEVVVTRKGIAGVEHCFNSVYGILLGSLYETA